MNGIGSCSIVALSTCPRCGVSDESKAVDDMKFAAVSRPAAALASVMDVPDATVLDDTDKIKLLAAAAEAAAETNSGEPRRAFWDGDCDRKTDCCDGADDVDVSVAAVAAAVARINSEMGWKSVSSVREDDVDVDGSLNADDNKSGPRGVSVDVVAVC